MKNIIKSLTIACGLLLVFTGCKEDKLMVFEGDNNVYFQSCKWPTATGGFKSSLKYNGRTFKLQLGGIGEVQEVVDSMAVSLAFLNPELASDTTYLPVSLMGRPQPHERKIGWKIVDAGDAVEGVDFKVLDAFIPANATMGGIVIEMFRENAGQGKYFDVKFQLTENENFKVNYPTIAASNTDTTTKSTIDMRLLWTDGLTAPPYWEGETAVCYPYLGAFSVRKVFVLHDELGVDWDIMYTKLSNGSTTLQTRCSVYGTLLYKWLIRYEEQNGVPYKEEDGTPMKAGAQYYI